MVHSKSAYLVDLSSMKKTCNAIIYAHYIYMEIQSFNFEFPYTHCTQFIGTLRNMK